jgi:hypothetical protein
MTMAMREAQDIVRALETLAKVAGVTVQDQAIRSAFFDNDVYAKYVEAVDLHNKFIDADIVTRGAMLGIKITEHEGGSYSTEMELSARSEKSTKRARGKKK